MRIGVPKEIKAHEYRVGMVPSSVRELVANGHEVWVQNNAGVGIDLSNETYVQAGAKIIDTAEQLFAECDMIVKVKEPQAVEYQQLRENQILFTYLHLAPDTAQTDGLQQSGCVAIAYETVTDKHGGLPLLSPMSEVAGRMSIQAGANCLEKAQGGRGVLLGGVPGVAPANVTVIGGGVVGTNALRMAIGMGARVTVLDKSLNRLRELDNLFGSKLNTLYSTRETLEEYVLSADLVVGAVLVPGAAAPKLVARSLLSKMHPGAVVVDVAIDQGGCFETSKPTTHSEPTYVVDGVVHYCVTNMPGAVARSSAFALNNATLPYIVAIANKGYKAALMEDMHLLDGLNVCHGDITYPAVAHDQNKTFVAPIEALARVK